MLLTFEKEMKFARSVYYFVFIYLFVGFVFFRFSGITKIAAKKQQKIDAKKAETTGKAATNADSAKNDIKKKVQ